MNIDRALLGRLRIEPLDRKIHDRAAFSCGEPRVDNYLKTTVAGHQDLDTTRCFVACLDQSIEIMGFYSMNAHGIDTGSLPDAIRKKLPRYDQIPAIYLSVVGVHDGLQGSGIGSYLMADAFQRSVDVADRIGAAFIVLDALNERAGKLYRRLGFSDLPGHEPRMIIGLRQVRAAVAAAAKPAKAEA